MKASAILLAGGASSRMGRDKALIEMPHQGGRITLLDYMYNLLGESGFEDIQVSRNRPSYINDNYKSQGPLAGIEAALPFCRHKVVVVVPVDMPRLTPIAIEALLQSEAPSAMLEGSALPCKISASLHIRLLLQTWLGNPNQSRSVRGFLAALKAETVSYPDTATLMNTNTPEEWRQYEKSV